MPMKVAPASPSPARRGLLLLLPALAGCSVLPSRPYQEVQRFSLAPERPQTSPPPARGPVLLLRPLRAAPGMDARGLRMLGAGGQVTTGYWHEWTAPPVELAEEALRRWLTASGIISAVTAPAPPPAPDRAESEPAVARAALSVLLLSQAPGSGGQPRILGQFMPEGTAPLAGGPWRDGDVPGPTAAAGMSAALAMALTALERDLRAAVRARR